MQEIGIYSDLTFPVTEIVNTTFGGFTDPIFYDFLKLFFIIFFFIFCVKIFGIFFGK